MFQTTPVKTPFKGMAIGNQTHKMFHCDILLKIINCIDSNSANHTFSITAQECRHEIRYHGITLNYFNATECILEVSALHVFIL